MPVLFALLLLPLVLFAQESFDPRRLDDSTSLSYFYPVVYPNNGSLLCTWASIADSEVSAVGRQMTLDGNSESGVQLFDVATRDTFPCPPALSVMPRSGGGEVRMVYHS